MKKLILILIIFTKLLLANNVLFNMYKLGKPSDEVVLIVGGIHGNEPGSYFAPSLIAKNYKITEGEVWVIPGLNIPSIQRNARGIYGDMNRKFKHIKKNDKDYKKVMLVKKLILNKKVKMILNLHDGHGFYRDKYINNSKNPKAWGQTTVIDQKTIDSDKYSNLFEIATRVRDRVNEDLTHAHYSFNTKNTITQFKNKEQQNSLTYFAITHHKAAFAIETSKNIKELSVKVLYQLKSIESFLDIANIKYSKDFNLTVGSIKNALNKKGFLKINHNINFQINGLRKYISYFPLKRKSNLFTFTHPLGSFRKKKGLYYIFIGNKHVSTLKPAYVHFDNAKYLNMSIVVDKEESRIVDFSSIINVKKSFKIKTPKKIRVNVIGYGNRNDGHKTIHYKNMIKRYSIDKNKRRYRVEFYREKVFLGMLIINFLNNK